MEIFIIDMTLLMSNHHDIAEILLKVALNTIILILLMSNSV